MISPSEHIGQVQAKVSKLIRQYKALEKENLRLKTELEKRTETEDQIKNRNRLLEHQLNLIKATTGPGDATAKKELEKQLNFYIKEIDRCIAILGQ